MSKVSDAMGGESKPKSKMRSSKEVHHTTVHKAANGGVILEHEFQDGSPEMHHHPDFESAVDQLREHYSPMAEKKEEKPAVKNPDITIGAAPKEAKAAHDMKQKEDEQPALTVRDKARAKVQI
jgi:hypothetical protein